MSTTPRQTVVFTRPQWAVLQEEAARLDVSVSEVIRRIIDGWREERARPRGHG
jgi:hypothetical protein